ncbi:MAG: AAA family ATPase [Deltaproteobacteria bacterium RIFOXYD12_FULL_50_9]|nr:MAG: AAA family ATPase [Deltaproteobacteria bacterium RIFOXYD12_FULL_50_9]
MKQSGPQTTAPLAERMRPQQIKDFIGQEHLLGKDKILSRLLSQQHIPSLILWGPPGTGKTTLARILARSTDADFVFFSAVLSGVKEIREIVAQATERKNSEHKATILFVDEIHRFNKSQQDGFLPHVESGLLTLIGATTENPSFQVIAPLLSRCRVLVLNPLTPENLRAIAERTLTDRENGLGSLQLHFEERALEHLIAMTDGDARNLLNSLEIIASFCDSSSCAEVTMAMVEEAIQRRSLRYDADGEEHYNLISALHKSLRDSDPDGALYWLVRMLVAGEEPLYIARRLIRFASEDIGIADSQALVIALQAREGYHILGSPEGELALAQATVYLATAPKSNAVYMAYNQVKRTIEETGTLPVPLHIRNAPTKLMKQLGYGKDYRYAHDQDEGLADQEHLPDELKGRTFYNPTNRGYEAIVKDRLHKWKQILAERRRENSR